MKNTIFLPKTIKVGYQSRTDTYTGQLAYVIYIDQKGVLRKETSWNSWRDNKIEPQDFSNEPTSGFVLNKKVGDYVSDWNHRQAYVRVYDPRNFEFEITIENLLYILENASSIKGKGLEGNFVYGWDGKDLLLIPTESPDYKEITEYSEIIFQKKYVKAKELILGATYKTKSNEEWIYMGRFDYHTTKYDKVLSKIQSNSWYSPSYDSVIVNVNKGKHHFFARETIDYKDNKYLSILTIKSLGERFIDTVSSDCVENYAELFEKLECKTDYSPYDENKDEYIRYTLEEFNSSINKSRWIHYYDNLKNKYEVYFGRDDIFHYRKIDANNHYGDEKSVQGTLEEIYNLIKPMYKNEYLENNKLYREGNK